MLRKSKEYQMLQIPNQQQTSLPTLQHNGLEAIYHSGIEHRLSCMVPQTATFVAVAKLFSSLHYPLRLYVFEAVYCDDCPRELLCTENIVLL